MFSKDEDHYATLSERCLRNGLPKFLNNDDWMIAYAYADELLRRSPEDFEVACALQYAAIRLLLGTAQAVIMATSLLGQRVAENLEAATRVILANDLVRKLDPTIVSSIDTEMPTPP